MRATRERSISGNKKDLSPTQREELLKTLKDRFEKNMNRHQGLEWAKVQAKLEANAENLWSLNEMERTGGEPDVVGHDKKTGEIGGLALTANPQAKARQCPTAGMAIRACSGV